MNAHSGANDMKRYVCSSTLSNVPSSFNINGLEELKDFVGTRGQIYDLIRNNNPLAIIDKRNAYVKIGDSSYLVILTKAEGGWRVRIIWQLDRQGITSGGQYYLQEDRFRPL